MQPAEVTSFSVANASLMLDLKLSNGLTFWANSELATKRFQLLQPCTKFCTSGVVTLG